MDGRNAQIAVIQRRAFDWLLSTHSGHSVASKGKSTLTVIADRDLMRRDRGEGCRQATREAVSRKVRQGSHHVSQPSLNRKRQKRMARVDG
jgi:hypothetical protein